MSADQSIRKHRDAQDTHSRHPANSGPNFDVSLSHHDFNRDYAAATRSTGTARPHDFRLTDHGHHSKLDGAHLSDSKHPGQHGHFKNIDASPHFQKQTQEAFKESFGRLKPEIQEKLKDVKVVTASHADKVVPGVPHDVPAVTPDKREVHANMMVFSEAGLKKDGAPIKDVMNHEIFHTVDNATGASRDPELRKAIDQGIKRLSAADQRHIAANGREQRDARYAEFAADIMAMEMGSKQKDLAYVTKVSNAYKNFAEAREIIRKKYLQ